MIKEYDIVKSRINLNDKVPTGCKGTVLIVYQGTLPAYEVEFFDNQSNTVGVLTVKVDEIEKL